MQKHTASAAINERWSAIKRFWLHLGQLRRDFSPPHFQHKSAGASYRCKGCSACGNLGFSYGFLRKSTLFILLSFRLLCMKSYLFENFILLLLSPPMRLILLNSYQAQSRFLLRYPALVSLFLFRCCGFVCRSFLCALQDFLRSVLMPSAFSGRAVRIRISRCFSLFPYQISIPPPYDGSKQ